MPGCTTARGGSWCRALVPQSSDPAGTTQARRARPMHAGSAGSPGTSTCDQQRGGQPSPGLAQRQPRARSVHGDYQEMFRSCCSQGLWTQDGQQRGQGTKGKSWTSTPPVTLHSPVPAACSTQLAQGDSQHLASSLAPYATQTSLTASHHPPSTAAILKRKTRRCSHVGTTSPAIADGRRSPAIARKAPGRRQRERTL